MIKYLAILSFAIVLLIASYFIYQWYKATEIVHKYKPAKHKSVKQSKSLLYRYYVPVVQEGVTYPLVICLHGGGGKGNDNQKQIDEIAEVCTSDSLQQKYPSFVIAPQCPKNFQWVNTNFTSVPFSFYEQDKIPESKEMHMIIELIAEFERKYPIDTTRIYILGFSMGSSGTWDMITRHPNLFSAAIMISGTKDTTKAFKVKHIPMKFFHGRNDQICLSETSERTYKVLHDLGADCELTLYNSGHVCFSQALKTPNLIDWLFSKRKLNLGISNNLDSL